MPIHRTLSVLAKRSDLIASGEYHLYCYNSPFIPLSRQYFELQLLVTDAPTQVAEIATETGAG